jgi:hypothetical protein
MRRNNKIENTFLHADLFSQKLQSSEQCSLQLDNQATSPPKNAVTKWLWRRRRRIRRGALCILQNRKENEMHRFCHWICCKIVAKIVVCFCHWIVARFVAQILYVFLWLIGLMQNSCFLLSLDCSKTCLQDCLVSYVCFH